MGLSIENLKKQEAKCFKIFNGKKFTLYKSGTKGEVEAYIKHYKIPKRTLRRKIKVRNEYRLYLYFDK